MGRSYGKFGTIEKIQRYVAGCIRRHFARGFLEPLPSWVVLRQVQNEVESFVRTFPIQAWHAWASYYHPSRAEDGPSGDDPTWLMTETICTCDYILSRVMDELGCFEHGEGMVDIAALVADEEKEEVH